MQVQTLDIAYTSVLESVQANTHNLTDDLTLCVYNLISSAALHVRYVYQYNSCFFTTQHEGSLSGSSISYVIIPWSYTLFAVMNYSNYAVRGTHLPWKVTLYLRTWLTI